MKIKDFVRIGLDALPSPSGRIFVHPNDAQIVDLSSVRILACSVDTVRQLYRG